MGPGASSLTPKQEAFCVAYMRDGDATRAYLEASPAVRRSTAKSEGARLLKNPNVLSRIAELREKVVDLAEITIASLIQELEHDRTLARKEGQPRAAVAATESIAKLAGLWVDKSETTHTMRPEEARALIGQLAGKYLPARTQ
jgi:phage terminase small subunit